jgi:hypothetical protein
MVVVGVVVEQVQAWRDQESAVEQRQAQPSNPASPTDRTQQASIERVPMFDGLAIHRSPRLPPSGAGGNPQAPAGLPRGSPGPATGRLI